MGPDSGNSWTPRAVADDARAGYVSAAAAQRDTVLRGRSSMLAEERRQRLTAAMREAGIGHMVLYGNAWQGDYLRYGADFGILEGHGIALIAADGHVELFLDSATDAERAELEAPQVKVHLAPDIARAVGARLDRVANAHIAAAPRRFLPRWLADARQNFKLDDATALVDRLLMHKSAGEIAAVRRAAQIADEAYVAFVRAVRPGRRQFEIVADIEAHLRRKGCPDNFMIIGSGGKDVFGMTPPSERRIAPGDLVTTELTPAVEGYYVQICRTLVAGGATPAPARAVAAGRACRRCGARRERCVPQIRPRRLCDQQVHPGARPRHRAVLRFQAAHPGGCRHHPRARHGA